MRTPTDVTTLLEDCRRGDDRAWADLVDTYESLVFATALQTGLNREDATDVFQQVWLELHRSLFRIRDPKALPRWLIVTTRRISYKQAILAGKWVHDTRADMIDPTPTAEAVILRLEKRHRLERALDALDRRCRDVLTALFLSGRKATYKEVSVKTGLSEDSIGSLRSRCLKRLRERFGDTP